MKIKVASFFALAYYTCVSMKLFSYYQVNKALRAERKLKKKFSNNRPSTISVNLTPIPEIATLDLKNLQDVVSKSPKIVHKVESCGYLLKTNKKNFTQKCIEQEDQDEILSYSPEPLVYYPDNLNYKGK